MLGSTRIARLDAKQESLRQSLLAEAPDFCNTIRPVAKTPKRKRIGRLQMSGQPKLFGGSIEEYQEATNQEIPLIMRSCIRVINLYGKFDLKKLQFFWHILLDLTFLAI